MRTLHRRAIATVGASLWLYLGWDSYNFYWGGTLAQWPFPAIPMLWYLVAGAALLWIATVPEGSK